MKFVYFWTGIALLAVLTTACQRNISIPVNPLILSTATPTFTFSPIFTQTPSFTATATFTFSPIFTSSPTFTPTISFTPTNTPTATSTPTATGVPGVDWYESVAAPAFSGRYFHSSVVFNNSMWVIGGFNGARLQDVLSSADGKTWNQATGAAAFSARYGQTSVTYGAPVSMWVIGGNTGTGLANDVWASMDGAAWSSTTLAAGFSPRYGLTSVVYNGLMWVIGGFDGAAPFDNDVWSSPDGITWTQVLANGPSSSTHFSGRAGSVCVVYNGAMYLTAGFDNVAPRTNDVWTSTDGITWTQLTPAAAFAGREEPTVLVYNNALWLIGGRTGAALMNDVWTSSDGITWNPVSNSTIFSPRYAHTSLVFNSGTGQEMWVIAGFGGGYLNDVWHSP